MIPKSNSSPSLSSLISSPRNTAQKDIKDKALTINFDLETSESSLFQKYSNSNVSSTLITKSLANYIEEIAAKIFSTKRETKPDAIKKELIQIIDLEKAKEVDFGDLSLAELRDLCVVNCIKLSKIYIKIHGFRLNKEKELDLIFEMKDYLYQNLKLLTNAYKISEEKYARLSNEPPLDEDEYGDIYS